MQACPLADVSATSLLSGFPEPMLVIEVDGTLVFANDAAIRLLEVENAGLRPDHRLSAGKRTLPS